MFSNLVNGDDGDETRVNVDTSIQSNNVTLPTESKLQKKVIKKCLDIAKKEGLQLRQTYTRTVKKLYVDLRFSKHPKSTKKVKKAQQSIKTIAGRLIRELNRLLPINNHYAEYLALFERLLQQKRKCSNKIYSLHEPYICCISKEKEHQMYVFGNKVSIVVTKYTGVIVGAKIFRNEFDGHKLAESLEQKLAIKSSKIKSAIVDRGYRGKKEIHGIFIQILKPFTKNK